MVQPLCQSKLFFVSGLAALTFSSVVTTADCSTVSPIAYVDDDAPSSGNGTSWSTAFQTIDDALAAVVASSCIEEVRVAQGTYYVDGGTGDEDARLKVCPGLSLSGGWRGLGTGGPSDDYNPKKFVTTISGEIGNPGSITDNSTGFIVVESTACPATPDAITRIQGFVFTKMYADVTSISTSREDVGIRAIDSTLLVAQCTFTDNLATAYSVGSVIGGGGLIDYGATSSGTPEYLTIVECSFIENTIYDLSDSSSIMPTLGIVTARFSREDSSGFNLARCTFKDNTGEALILVDSFQSGNFTISDTLLAENEVDTCIYNYGRFLSPYRYGLIQHCTFTENDQAGTPSHAVISSSNFAGESLFMHNSIFDTSAGSVQFFVNEDYVNGSGTITGPDVITNCWLSTPPAGTGSYSGNIGPGGSFTTPGFVSVNSGNFNLLPTSPCVDRADNPRGTDNLVVKSPDELPLLASDPIDLAGHPRYVDMPSTDTGITGGVGGTVLADLGALEVQTDWDCNNNGTPDSQEILMGSATDADGNGVIDSCGTDCDSNGIEDAADIYLDTHPDCDLNGIPDVAGCEPDCDGDGAFDGCEIVSLIELDVNLNGVPDDCDEDCNENGRVDTLECYFDVVILLDTSGSMTGPSIYCDVRTEIEAKLDSIQTNGQGEGGRVRLYRISSTFSSATPTCEETSSSNPVYLVDELSTTVPDFDDMTACECQSLTVESWGTGTALAATADDTFWLIDSRRIIVPIADQSPCDGEYQVNSDDVDSIDLAIEKSTSPTRPASVYPVIEADTVPDVLDEARRLVAGIQAAGVSGSDLISLSRLATTGPVTPERIANRILENILALDQTCAVCREDCPVDLAEPFGILDLTDITAFIIAFQNQQTEADLAEPFGVFDLADLTAFISIFQQGCP